MKFLYFLLLGTGLVAAACGGSSGANDVPDAALEPWCGNGILEAGEDCEVVGDDTWPVGCNACAICGNGLVSGRETCDDGNTAPGDGCSACLRPGDPTGWSPDVEHLYLLVPRPGGGVHGLRFDGQGQLQTVEASVNGSAATRTANIGYSGPFAVTSAVDTPDGGVVACLVDQRADPGGVNSLVVALDPTGAFRWAHAVDTIPGRMRRCEDVVVGGGQAVFALEATDAHGNLTHEVSSMVRLDLATGALVRETVLSSYFDPGALGVLHFFINEVAIRDDASVVVSGFVSNGTGSVVAAFDAQDALTWKTSTTIQGSQLYVAGDRLGLVGDGVALLQASTGAMIRSWSFDQRASLIAVDRAMTTIVTAGPQEGDYVRFASWSIDGTPRFDILQARGLDGRYDALALGDDGATYYTHSEVGSDGRLGAFSQ